MMNDSPNVYGPKGPLGPVNRDPIRSARRLLTPGDCVSEANSRRAGENSVTDEPGRQSRELARPVQVEAGAWGIMKAINDAFINPLLLVSGAGSLAIGIYNSGANLFGFGAGWLGPRLAGRVGSSSKATLICLGTGRAVFLLLVGYLLATPSHSVTLIITLIFIWGIGEGLALPLWTNFLAGLVGPGQRGKWLAMRASAATMSTIPVMIGVVLIFIFASREQALPIAYGLAAVCSVVSFFMVRRIFALAGPQPVPAARSVHSLPKEAGARQFLGGVFVFWFGSALSWPILPKYILDDLHAPAAYFAFASLIAATMGTLVQRRWGRLSDERGAMLVLLLGGIGASFVPIIWTVIPLFWLGFSMEFLASISWPGHMLGLTMRSVELAKDDQDRASLLGWTNLAQGAGACFSPLFSSILVGHTGIAAVLLLSGALRLLGTGIMSQPILRQRLAQRRLA
jgi:MFS family permease